MTHDLFWNLLPVSPSANAKKSDSLPCLDRYLSPFISRHYQAARTLGKLLPAATSTERKSFHAVLQQYADLFEATEQDLLSYSPQEFEGRLQSEIRLQIERAKRLHFAADWTWETTMS